MRRRRSVVVEVDVFRLLMESSSMGLKTVPRFEY